MYTTHIHAVVEVHVSCQAALGTAFQAKSKQSSAIPALFLCNRALGSESPAASRSILGKVVKGSLTAVHPADIVIDSVCRRQNNETAVNVDRTKPDGGLAQLGERLNGIQKVSGSNPLSSTSQPLGFQGVASFLGPDARFRLIPRVRRKVVAAPRHAVGRLTVPRRHGEFHARRQIVVVLAQ